MKWCWRREQPNGLGVFLRVHCSVGKCVGQTQEENVLAGKVSGRKRLRLGTVALLRARPDVPLKPPGDSPGLERRGTEYFNEARGGRV